MTWYVPGRNTASCSASEDTIHQQQKTTNGSRARMAVCHKQAKDPQGCLVARNAAFTRGNSTSSTSRCLNMGCICSGTSACTPPSSDGSVLRVAPQYSCYQVVSNSVR